MEAKRSSGQAADGAMGWREASRVLRERSQVAWAVSAAIEQVLADYGLAGEDNPLQKLQGIVAQAVPPRDGAGSMTAGRAPGHAMPSGRSEPGNGMSRELAWRQLHASDLSGQAWPVVWFATGTSGTESATLALGAQRDGQKRVLGVWSGSASENRCGQRIAAELRGRGLGRGSVWLGITEGDRALEMALRQQWAQKVVVAHCQRRTAREVVAHLPVAARQPAERALQAAWDAPDGHLARARLETLAEGWQATHPGAAARLRSAVVGTTVVQALALRGAMAERLRTSAPAAYLLEQCLPAARQQTGRAWIATVAAEALRRQAGFRRLSGCASLECLTNALVEQAGAGIPSTAAGR